MREKRLIDALPLDDEHTPYFAAIGRFFVAYAEAESALVTSAVVLSGISSRKARVIFSKMRTDEIIERIRHLIKLKRKKSPELFLVVDSCLRQLKAISHQRNKLAHRRMEVDFKNGGIEVSNEDTSHVFSRIETDVFTLEDLERMRRDCMMIFLRLCIGSHDPAWLSDPPPFVKGFFGPWFYEEVPAKRGRSRGRVVS